ncbi:hypothetical protein CYY_002191 [Polysphondylium violaceum]|uniref:Methyltransferase domain-containing protein n=1 Tax=Polysphondylium violaceum TaxID=133409 RepID=A0A8J4V349_9MYCE|nr:hypothetical protein CYY_002191 [Polysphondylium violaceum]
MSNSVKQTKIDQTAEGWGNCNRVRATFSKNVYTAQYANDCMDLTMGTRDIRDPNIKILDVAAGTGALSFVALDRIQNSNNSFILATDFSEKMIAYMNNVIKQEKYKNIEAKVMDGQCMSEIQDNLFNYVYSVFGAIYFPDRAKGFREFYRVLKANGKMAVTAWRVDTSFVKIFTYAFKQLVGDESLIPLKNTVLSLSDKHVFKSELEQAGFRDVEIHSVTHYMSFPTVQAFLAHWQQNPVYEDIIAFLTPARKQEFDNHILAYLAANYPDTTKIPCPCYIGVGTK